jgi:hypothetical protein
MSKLKDNVEPNISHGMFSLPLLDLNTNLGFYFNESNERSQETKKKIGNKNCLKVP